MNAAYCDTTYLFKLQCGESGTLDVHSHAATVEFLVCALHGRAEFASAAIRQLVIKAITTEGQVIDVFTAAGLSKPDIFILSDQFLAEVRGLKHKNVAAALLEKLLKDELKVRSKRNLVQSQVFSEKLKKTLNAYHNRAISTMEVIEELIKLAKDLDAATKVGEDMGLTDDEVAFYDALASNNSAVQAMGDDNLKVHRFRSYPRNPFQAPASLARRSLPFLPPWVGNPTQSPAFPRIHEQGNQIFAKYYG